MIKRFFNFLNYELKGVHQAALLLGIAAILSKILALLRDRMLAGAFGTGETLDIYFASFRMPDFIYALILFATSSTALIPLLLEKSSDDNGAARMFLSDMLKFFLFIILILNSLCFLLMPAIADFMVPGFSEKAKIELIALSRILLLSPLLLGLSNIFSSVIQSHNRFFVYSLSPILYNVGIILGITTLYPKFGISGLAWGVAAGSLLHFLTQVPSLIKLGFHPSFSSFRNTKIFSRSVKETLKYSFPRTLGLSFNQIVLLVITFFASLIGSGSVAIFNFSNNLQSIPLSIIGMSYSVAAFPVLAKLFIKNEKKDFSKNICSVARHIIFWSLPLSIMFVVLRAQIVRLILGTGAFNWVDTKLTAASLAIFSVSIVSQNLILLFAWAFYAAGKTKKPLIINAFSSAAIIMLIPIFLRIFSHYDYAIRVAGLILRIDNLTDIRIIALPLAFSAGSIINAFFLWIYLKKDFGISQRTLMKSLSQVFVSGLLAGFATYASLNVFNNSFDTKTFIGLFMQGVLSALFGAIVCVLALQALKNKEFKEIKNSLMSKFWKVPVVVQEQEKLM